MGLVLITGAGGYLGGLLAHAYARERGADQVRCVVRQRPHADRLAAAGFEVVSGDLMEAAVRARATEGTKLVIHAAARLGTGLPAEFSEVNAGMTRWLSEAALAERARMVYISTIEAYGCFAGRTLREDQPHLPNGHPYSESKYAGEQGVSRTYRLAGCADYCIVRPGMIYGPASPYWTQRYLRMAAQGGIGVLGDGGRVFPVFDADVVRAVMTAATADAARGQIYNLVHDEALSWWDWAHAHHQLVGRGAPHRESVAMLRVRSAVRRAWGWPTFDRRLEVELREARIPHKKARVELGWHPVRFRAGMVRCAPALTRDETQ
ncbi:nucleoside-diphosphate-sugar epimerase [Nocardia sp. GAS34]|uniref:NAD-dependent epimerase/dehydratase family protein n=1 Tax=unclassified Nocardia TaxID=2637762 RepID=UPI003D25E102